MKINKGIYSSRKQYYFLKTVSIKTNSGNIKWFGAGQVVWGTPFDSNNIKVFIYAKMLPFDFAIIPNSLLKEYSSSESFGIDAARSPMLTPLGMPFVPANGREHEDTLVYSDMFLNATGATYTLKQDYDGVPSGTQLTGTEDVGFLVTKYNGVEKTIPLTILTKSGGGGVKDTVETGLSWLERLLNLGKGAKETFGGSSQDSTTTTTTTTPTTTPTKGGGMSVTSWVLIGAGVIALAGTIIYFSTRGTSGKK